MRTHRLRGSRRSTTLALFAAGALTLSACGADDAGTEGADTGAGEGGAVTETPAEPTDPGTGDDQAAQDEPVAQVDDLEGVETQVTVDEAFLEAVTGLGLTPGVVGEAGFDPETGTFTFPITGGDLTVYEEGQVEPAVQGGIEHDGSGLSLTDGTTTVELTDFVVDPGEGVLTGTVSADGEEAASDAPLFSIDDSTMQPLQVDEAAGTATLSGATLVLTQEAADLLNETFGTDALAEGVTVGTATVVVQLPEDAGAGTGTETEGDTEQQ